MAQIRFEGELYEVVEPDDWDTTELSEAEHAVGFRAGDESTGDVLRIQDYISVRRKVSTDEIGPVQLADRVGKIKFRDRIAEVEAEENPTPFEPATGLESLGESRVDLETSGRPLSVSSE